MLPQRPARGSDSELDFWLSQPGFETSEVRWFGVGPLPPPVVTWFTSSPVIVEHRRDTYWVDGSGELGVKRRNGVGLEAKVRRATEGLVELFADVGATIEDWVKLSDLEEAQLPRGAGVVCVEVTKSVRSKIYQFDGRGELFQATTRNLATPGCDVELAEIALDDREAWTFALEAWGPHEVRRPLLQSTVSALRTEEAPPGFREGLDQAMGYPEWLAGLVSSLS